MKKLYTRAVSVLLCTLLLMSGFAYAAPVEMPASQSEAQPAFGEDVEFKIAGEAATTSKKAIVVIPGVGGSRLSSGGQIVWISNEASKLDRLAYG